MKLSDFLVEYLYEKGVTHVFELSGGMIANFLESLYNFKKIQVVSMRHEQGVAFAVDGFSRVSTIPGVGFGTSGPGAINLLTGIGSCYFDSVPAIFITGQVNLHEMKGDRTVRQLGFQETDIASMARSVCKAVYELKNAEDLPMILDEAFELSKKGRPGPVLIDIPMNLQGHQVFKNDVKNKEPEESKNIDVDFQFIIEKIKKSRKPLLLAGRGVTCSSSNDLFLKFAERYKIPVVSSLLGLESISYKHPLRVGFIGTYGNRWANLALGESDLLIVLGSRLDIRQTGADVRFFSSREIIHVEIETGEINNRVNGCIPYNLDLNEFLNGILQVEIGYNGEDREDWMLRINELRRVYPDTEEVKTEGINPNYFLHKLSQKSSKAGAFLADVGNHQMWCAQSLELNEGQHFLTSGGMGAMGYSLPASIGAFFSTKKPVVSISGDGGFQLNIQELETIISNNLPIKIVVLNNKSLGMIRQFQECYFSGHYQSSIIGYSCPNFEKIAQAYGIDAMTITQEEDIDGAMEKMWDKSDKPFLLQVMIEQSVNCYPKIAFGRPLTEMEPLSEPIELEGT